MNFSNPRKKEQNEPTRQFEQIWREHHDPEARTKRILKQRKEDKIREQAEDLGLNIKSIRNYDGG